MPRQARLDAPGTLHHVMVRGLGRRVIFREDADRDDFFRRLAALAEVDVLLVRTGRGPLIHTGRDFRGYVTRRRQMPWSEVPVARRNRRW